MNKNKYLYRQFFSDLMPIYPLYLLYFESKGMSLQQIALLVAIWSLPVVMLEIPSGVLADRWSRRGMIIWGSIGRSACYLVWVFSDRFWLFALGFILWGIGGAFISGAEEALLFDSLKQGGEEERFDVYLGRGRFLSGIGNILAAVGGGYIGMYLGISWALYLSVAFCLITAVIAFLYKEVNYYREEYDESAEQKETIREAFNFIMGKKQILLFSILAIIVVGVAGVLDEYDALIAKDYGLTVSGIGIWSAIRFIMIALGSFSAHYMKRLFEKLTGVRHRIYLVGVLCIIGAVSLGVSGLLKSFTAMGLYGLYYLIMAAAEVHQEDFIQQNIEEEGRSTVHSIISLTLNLFAILYVAALGLVLKLTSLHGMLVFIAGYSLLLTMLLLFIFSGLKKKA